MNMKTSFARQNGDTPLTVGEKIGYIKENIKFIFCSDTGVYSSIETNNLFDRHISAHLTPSPSRIITDMLVVEKIKKMSENIKPLVILDIGCGKGQVLKLIEEFTDLKRKTDFKYIGLDIERQNWCDEKNAVCFVEGSAEELNKVSLPFDVNFVISQSALEHIKYDINFFEQQKKIKNTNPIEFVHIVPYRYSFFLYFFHGWRVYNKNLISQLSGDLSIDISIYGGFFKFILHAMAITFPEKVVSRILRKEISLRKNFASFYRKLLKLSFILDNWCMKIPFLRCCTTAVIHGAITENFTNATKRI